MESHSVTCHPAEVTFQPLPQPKLLLNLATRRDARLSWPGCWLYPKIVYPAKYNHLSQKIIGQCHGWELNPRPKVSSPASYHYYTTDPPWQIHMIQTNIKQVRDAENSFSGYSVQWDAKKCRPHIQFIHYISGRSHSSKVLNTQNNSEWTLGTHATTYELIVK